MHKDDIKKAWRKLYTSMIVGIALLILGISLSFTGHKNNTSAMVTIIVGSAAIIVSLVQMAMFKKFLKQHQEEEN